MAAKKRSPKGTKRDISTALEIAKTLQLTVAPDLATDAQRLVEILEDLDARRSRRQKAYRARVEK